MFRQWKEKKEMIANYPDLELKLTRTTDMLRDEMSRTSYDIVKYRDKNKAYDTLQNDYYNIQNDYYNKGLELRNLKDENDKLRVAIVNLNDKKNKEIENLSECKSKVESTIFSLSEQNSQYKNKIENLEYAVNRFNKLSDSDVQEKFNLLQTKYDLLTQSYEYVEIDGNAKLFNLELQEYNAKGYTQVKSEYIDGRYIYILAKLKNQKPCT